MPRALMKTMTYSLMHLAVAFCVAYGLTGNLAVALGIGLIEPVFQTFAYMIHERVWERAVPGRSAPVQSVHACSQTLIRIRDHAETQRGNEAVSGPVPAPA